MTRRDRRTFLRVCGGAALASGLTGCLYFEQPGGRDGPERPSEEDDVPAAAFSFYYVGADRTVEIAHDGGEHVRRSRLAIRGEGFTAVSAADQTSPGTWGGTASGRLDDAPAVETGNSVTVGASSAYELRVVYADGDRTRVLAEDDGPDA